MTVQLDPCPVCGFADWPPGGMHAARAIHIREHERRGDQLTEAIQVKLGRGEEMGDTAKYPSAPRVIRDRMARSSAPLTWPAVVLVGILAASFVGCVWAVAWGIHG